MDKRMAKRLLSLVLAVEMFCSPLAMARAADPAQVRPETPLGEEVVERVPSDVAREETPAVDDAPVVDDSPTENEDQADNAPAVDDKVHGGVSASSGGNASAVSGSSGNGDRAAMSADGDYIETVYQMAMSFGIPLERNYPKRYDGYYKQETTSTLAWGYRVNARGYYKMPVKHADNWYITLPDVGRLPDLELEGFYIMGEKPSTMWYTERDGSENSNQVLGWEYNESWDNAVRLTPTDKTPDDVDLTYDDDQDVGRYANQGDYTCVAVVSDEELQEAKAKGRYGYSLTDSAMEIEPGVWVDSKLETYYIPVVGRWQASSHNELTGLRVITGVEENGGAVTQETMESVYTENPRMVTEPEELKLSDISDTTFADPDAPREFWVRVPEDQETLSLELAAFEPYYDYNVKNQGTAPVSVQITFNGKEVKGLNGQSIGVTAGWLMNNGKYSPGAVPEALTDASERYVPNNGWDSHAKEMNPARSYWRVANIPLGKVADAKDMDNDPFTTVTLTIAAPNGEKAVYTIHVERLMTPVYQLGYGNTPVAMIEKDSRGNWGTTTEAIRAAKDAAITDFKEHHRLGNDGVVAPGDTVYYKGDYNTNAWQGLRWEGQTWEGLSYYNIDLDPTAIVAYQDMAFSDPGVTFIGSNGKTVEFGADAAGDYKTCVTRTIQLKTADKLTVDLYGGVGGRACWYTVDGSGKAYLSDTQVSQTLQNADGSDVVDLRGLNVLPGVYTMTYTLTDPLAPGQPLVAKRPLVVLPIPGDVDMDGAVTLADALALAANQSTWDATTATSDVKLLRNRVWGAVSVSDILGGFQPVLADRGRTDYYYPPLDTQDVYDRKVWSQVEMTGSARLELRYLGLEQGILQGEEGHTTPVDGQMGPWMTNKNGKVTIREPNSYGHYQTDVFWVGVYLTAGELAGSTVEDLTLSLVYDSEYVTPTVVYQNINPFTGDSDQHERWLSAIYYYNMGDGSKYNSAPQTLFSGLSGTDYSYRSGTDWSRAYATHYSKVIGQLETVQGANSSSLREMVVCFQGGSSSNSRRITLKDGCLLVMPFQLIKHPSASRIQNGQAQLVELSAGMRDLNMVAKAPSGATRGTDMAALFGRMLSAAGEEDFAATLAADAGVATYAFSAQNSIYGDATQNIREDFGAVASSTIPIGENKTTTTVLTEGTYAEKYNESKDVPATGAITEGRLPKGLDYNSFTGSISGTPEEAGTFEFTLTRAGTEYYYTLTIQKRTLRFTPVSVGSYYGQPEYRGRGGNGDFTFVYKAEDLADRDRPAGATSGDRPGAELEDILGGDGVYTAPTFTARESTDTAAKVVEINTSVGNYPIVLENRPLDDKYELRFDENNLSTLTVFRRPVLVDYITVDFDDLRASGYTGIASNAAQIYSDSDRLDQVMTLTELDSTQPMIHLCLPQAVGGVYYGRKLTGDARVPGDTLTLRFAGEFQRESKDVEHFPDNNDMFYMTSGSEKRSISRVSNLTLSNSNYVLETSDRVQTPDSNDIVGTVTRREITELVMASYPYALTENGSATYGESIQLKALRMKIFRNGQQVGDLPFDFTYDYDGVTAMAMDIHYNWITREEMEAGLASPNSLVGSGCEIGPDGQLVDRYPYSETNDNGWLTCELDGMYLCAIARKFETSDPDGQLGENGYVKCYSDYPIKVQKRTLTLTLKSMNRFYGEESAQAQYTFSTAQLSMTDLQKLRALYPNGYSGNGDELAQLLGEGFTRPTIEFMKQPRPSNGPNDPNIVTVDTDVSGTTYYIVMHGAQSTNYTFRYARADGDRQASDQFGTALLNIWTRPIVVEDIVSMYASPDGDGKDNFGILYADSKELKLTQQVDGATKTAFQAGPGQVTFTGPEYNAATKSVSFYNAEDSVKKSQTDVVYTGDAVYGNDLQKLGVSYTVQFIPDQEHYTWSGFSQNYFSVTNLEAEGGQGQRPVEIGALKLTGEKAKNYRLVYKDAAHAMPQAPANATLINAPKPTQGMDTGNTAYMQYGTGRVILRAIKSMSLKSVGRMEYGYGEVFSPGEPNPTTNKRFELEVQYDTQYENNPAQYVGDTRHNISTESVVYSYESDSDTFTRRGFTIHYIDAPNGSGAVTDEQKRTVAMGGQQIIMGGDNLYYTVHDGRYLFVSGKRGENDPMVYSAVSDSPLKVSSGQLTLMARDVHRFYGEENAAGYVIQESYDPQDNVKPFTYTFRAAQLSRWDRERMSALLGRTIAERDILTQADLENALAIAAASDQAEDRTWAQSFGYTAPTISTTADKTSGVNMGHGKWGEYAVDISVKNFANYEVTGQPGTLYVYPRPIRITAINSSEEKPVYTIYNQTQGTIFNTSLEQSQVVVERGNNFVTGLTTWAQTLANSNRSAQLRLTGDPLVGEDEMTYKTTVQYLDGTTLPEGETDAYKKVVAIVTGLGSSPDGVERNYLLTKNAGGSDPDNLFEDANAVGAVKLRTIGYITIEQLPKLDYTYGDTLDLSSLKVQVVYRHLSDESSVSERVHVTYMDSNQFQSYGLYVNYWDMSRDTLPTTDEGRKTLPVRYRKASSDDHLTIAPTHDTQGPEYDVSSADPLMRPFAANGMALIVSAFQDGEKQTAADPKIIAALPVSLEVEGVDSYEVTAENPYAAKVKVAPLRLTYTVQATDKTYNGDTRTAGTVRLTNVFDRTGVQIQNINVPYGSGTTNQTVRGDITDVIYLPVGAGYEGAEDGDYHKAYTDLGYRVANGAIAFTTGTYAYLSDSLMAQNDVVEWAEGYGWDRGLLEFTFANPNVHYEDDTYGNGLPGVGTADLAQYWRANQDLNTVQDRWDTYPNISQMPVEIRNMKLLGPDAANYTWGLSDQAQTHETELTLEPDTLAAAQVSLPYATIHKANRQSIQTLLGRGYKLPELEVDEHTDVVRLTYGEDLSRVKDMTDPVQGDPETVRNDTGVDDYRDELHFEYALAYEDGDGLLRQWAGKDGAQGYQDTRFFGGEVFLPILDEAYVPDIDRLDKVENASDRTVYRGQRYRWAEEDTGLSEGGYREDSGFYIDPTFYPGYATYGEAVREAYWYYDLYNTDRDPLPRDTVFYPLVRLAETHNYNPSSDLTGDADGDGVEDITAQSIYDARLAVRAYDLGGGEVIEQPEETAGLMETALSASQIVLTAGEKMADAARKLAQDEVEADAELASGNFPDVAPERPGAIAAVKTYRLRLDMVAASWERNTASGDGEYLAQLVEAIEFTDTMQYPEQKLMDAVVYNHPTRYYSYAWDPDRSAQLRFGDADNPIDFGTTMSFAIRQRQPGGATEELTWTYDPEETGCTAQIYVTTHSGGGGQKVRFIEIVPSVLYARVGDSPVQLGLVTTPELPSNRKYTWSSSDPSVVTVSATGLVTFRGEGTAEITVTSTNGKSCTITVTVSPALGATTIPGSLFNFRYAGPWAILDGKYAFRPKDGMTRGEVVQLLDLFLDPDREWGATQEVAYVDITRKERYYGALARLTNVGVVKGVPGSAFAGERLATRAEFVTMLARMLKLDTPDTVGMAHAFADSGEDSTWAYAYIDAMAKAGVILGVGGGNFAPSRDITREEVAVILSRLLTVKLDTTQAGLITPSDMTPENWSYPSVLRAINTVLFPD